MCVKVNYSKCKYLLSGKGSSNYVLICLVNGLVRISFYGKKLIKKMFLF